MFKHKLNKQDILDEVYRRMANHKNLMDDLEWDLKNAEFVRTHQGFKTLASLRDWIEKQ